MVCQAHGCWMVGRHPGSVQAGSARLPDPPCTALYGGELQPRLQPCAPSEWPCLHLSRPGLPGYAGSLAGMASAGRCGPALRRTDARLGCPACRWRGMGVAGSDSAGEGGGWRVFVSHTCELRDYPPGNSYVAAAERAISAEGHVIVDMADFPAADQVPAELCMDRVRGCRVYVGVLGTRYGSPVRDKPEVSYTELEFQAATAAGLARLVFVLDEGAADVGLPVSALIDREFGARQDAFRRRVREAGLVT